MKNRLDFILIEVYIFIANSQFMIQLNTFQSFEDTTLRVIKSPKTTFGDLMFLLRFLLLSLPNNVWRLIVFAPFLIIIFIIIKSPKQSLGDLLFLLHFLLLSLPNKIWETYCFCSVSYYNVLLLSLPNKVWETYCFCSVSFYYFYYY